MGHVNRINLPPRARSNNPSNNKKSANEDASSELPCKEDPYHVFTYIHLYDYSRITLSLVS